MRQLSLRLSFQAELSFFLCVLAALQTFHETGGQGNEFQSTLDNNGNGFRVDFSSYLTVRMATLLLYSSLTTAYMQFI